MSTTAIDNPTAALAELVDNDPACADRAQLGELMRLARKVRGFLDGYDIACARRARHLNAQGQSESAFGMFLDSGCGSGKEAHANELREGVCGELPEFEDALAAGDVSKDHLDAIARNIKNLTDQERGDLKGRTDEVLESATGHTAEAFDKHLKTIITQIKNQYRPDSDLEEHERQRRNSNITDWVDKTTGMHKTLIELDPLRHDEWSRLYRAHLNRLRAQPGSSSKTWQQLKVDAFLATVAGNANSAAATNHDDPAGASPAGAATAPPRVPKVIVLIDLLTMLNGRHPGTVAELSNGTPIPPALIQQMLCDADIVPAVLNTTGEVLHLGRTTRLATRAQRDALRAIYTTCIEPGCSISVDDCHAHHVDPWEHGGATDIDNFVPVCPDAHDKLHTKGWKLTVTNPHSITWTRPDGTTSYHGPAPNLRQPPPPPAPEPP